MRPFLGGLGHGRPPNGERFRSNTSLIDRTVASQATRKSSFGSRLLKLVSQAGPVGDPRRHARTGSASWGGGRPEPLLPLRGTSAPGGREGSTVRGASQDVGATYELSSAVCHCSSSTGYCTNRRPLASPFDQVGSVPVQSLDDPGFPRSLEAGHGQVERTGFDGAEPRSSPVWSSSSRPGAAESPSGSSATAQTATAAARHGFRGAPALGASVAADFALRDQDGRVVRLSAQRGRFVLLTFLYTHCPDVCPLLASNLNLALRELTRSSGTASESSRSASTHGETRARPYELRQGAPAPARSSAI